MKKHGLVIATLVVVALLIAPLTGQAQDGEKKEKPRLSLQGLFMAGLISQSPGQFMWMPDSQSFLYQYQGALNRFDIASGETTKVSTMGEIRGSLMTGREKREGQGMGNTNATGRFNRSAMIISHDGTLLVGLLDNDLYLVNTADGSARWLTDDNGIEQFQRFSPDDTKVAYVKNHDIYMTDIQTGEETRLTQTGTDEIWNGEADWVYEEELSMRQAFWWAPDSNKIAYLQFDTRPVKEFLIIDHLNMRPDPEVQKFPQAGEENSKVTVGIVDVAGKTTWMNMGEETDYYVYGAEWCTSGNYLAYKWMNRAQNKIELRAANPETGNYNVLVTEERDTWLNAESSWLSKTEMLYFLPDDSFLWLSERSNWFHIYHYAKDGTLIKQLTDGEWMVDGMNRYTDQYVYFTGRTESPLGKQLYRVQISGGEIERLTSESGTHSSSVSPDGNYYITTHSAIDVQPETRLFKTPGELVATLKSNENPQLNNFNFNLTKLGQVTAEDGTVLYTAMTLPPDFDETKKYPVIVYVYGGAGVQTIVDAWNPGLIIYHQLFAAKDYIVFSLDNRGTYGRGHAFEAPVHLSLGTIEVDDQLVGINWLKTLPYVDGENIGMTGGSYGGYMTLMTMFKAPGVVKAGAAQFPGVNWEHYDTIYTERYMSTPEKNPEGYKEANAANFADKLEGKLLINQGMMDNNVHMQQTVELLEALIKGGKEYYMYFYPRERHGIGTPHRFFHNEKVVGDFFDRYLKGGKE